jgi:hypothetical protein
VVKHAVTTPQAYNALARLADQALGKPLEAEEDSPEDDVTREQRAVIPGGLTR